MLRNVFWKPNQPPPHLQQIFRHKYNSRFPCNCIAYYVLGAILPCSHHLNAHQTSFLGCELDRQIWRLQWPLDVIVDNLLVGFIAGSLKSYGHISRVEGHLDANCQVEWIRVHHCLPTSLSIKTLLHLSNGGSSSNPKSCQLEQQSPKMTFQQICLCPCHPNWPTQL